MNWKELFEQTNKDESLSGALHLQTKRKPIIIDFDSTDISVFSLYWAVRCYNFDKLKLTDKGIQFFKDNDPGEPPKWGCACAGGNKKAVSVVELKLKNEDLKPKAIKKTKNG